MRDSVVVFVTVGSAAEGDRLARSLVEAKLAACVNRLPGIQSVYFWEGKLEQSAEELLVIKTRKALFPALEKHVRELHSYAVPEVIALPIVAGSEPYLQWLSEQTTGDVGKPGGEIPEKREISAGGRAGAWKLR